VKTLQELFSEAGSLGIREAEISSNILFFDGLRDIMPVKNNKLPKFQKQKKLESNLKKLQAEILEIKKRFAKRLRRPELIGMKDVIFLNFICVNYCLNGNKIKKRFEKIIPANEITENMIRKADNKVAKRKKPRKKKKELEFSLNIEALRLNARQTSGYPMVNVVGEGSRYRRRGSFLSR